MYACPKCESEQTQALPLVVSSGTTSIDARTVAAGISSGASPSFCGAVTYGRTETMLAKTLSPPQKMRKDNLFAIVLLGLPLSLLAALVLPYGLAHLIFTFPEGPVGTTLLFWLPAGLLYFGAISSAIQKNRAARAYNRLHHSQDYENWRNSALCLRCGHIFSPSN